MEETQSQRDLQALREFVGQVSTGSKTLDGAKKIAQKKLYGCVSSPGEVDQIAEDALSHVTVNLLSAIDRGTTSLTPAILEKARPDSHVLRFLRRGVIRYCDTRLRRWTQQDEKGKIGARARYLSSSSPEDDDSEAPQIREVWDDLKVSVLNAGELDSDKIDGILATKGISSRDIDYLRDHYAGMSYVEIAQRDGGTSDKYRKIVTRALARISPDSLNL